MSTTSANALKKIGCLLRDQVKLPETIPWECQDRAELSSGLRERERPRAGRLRECRLTRWLMHQCYWTLIPTCSSVREPDRLLISGLSRQHPWLPCREYGIVPINTFFCMQSWVRYGGPGSCRSALSRRSSPAKRVALLEKREDPSASGKGNQHCGTSIEPRRHTPDLW